MSDAQGNAPVEYRQIDWMEGYEFGSDGSIRSRWTRGGLVDRWHMMKSHQHRNTKHWHVRLRIGDGETKTFHVGCLILEAFKGKAPQGMECCHFPDPDPTNNRIENLSWGTRQTNMAHRVIHGIDHKGERHPMAKLTDLQAEQIRKMRSDGLSGVAVAKIFGVTPSTVCRIHLGKRKMVV